MIRRSKRTDSYQDGKEKIVVLLKNYHPKFSDVEPLDEQLSDNERLGTTSSNVKAEVELVSDDKARLIYNSDEASDFDVLHYLRHNEDEE